MTNFEKYKDEILEIIEMGSPVALVDDKPVRCHGLKCSACDFEGKLCHQELFKWLYSEYKEPAPKLTAKERAFCEMLCNKEKIYIARDKCNQIYVYHTKPRKNERMWLTGYQTFIEIDSNTFSFIKWEDEEPWSIEDLLKLEVEND